MHLIGELLISIWRKYNESIFWIKFCWNSKLNFLLNSLYPDWVDIHLWNHVFDFFKKLTIPIFFAND